MTLGVTLPAESAAGSHVARLVASGVLDRDGLAALIHLAARIPSRDGRIEGASQPSDRTRPAVFRRGRGGGDDDRRTRGRPGRRPGGDASAREAAGAAPSEQPLALLPLCTPAEAARLLAVPESWLRRQVTARLVPHTRLGKHLRFSHADLVLIVAAGAYPAAAAVPARRPLRSRRPRRRCGPGPTPAPQSPTPHHQRPRVVKPDAGR